MIHSSYIHVSGNVWWKYHTSHQSTDLWMYDTFIIHSRFHRDEQTRWKCVYPFRCVYHDMIFVYHDVYHDMIFVCIMIWYSMCVSWYDIIFDVCIMIWYDILIFYATENDTHIKWFTHFHRVSMESIAIHTQARWKLIHTYHRDGKWYTHRVCSLFLFLSLSLSHTHPLSLYSSASLSVFLWGGYD